MLLFLFFLICCLQTIRMYLSYRFLRQKIQKNKNSNGKKLFLLIPVFNEQTVIEDSVKHFSQFASNYIKIVYITTSREKSIRNFPTTKELLEKMSKLYCFELINCPITKNAVMAHQLNYALVQLQKQYGDDFIFGIYNVDSRITPDILQDVQQRISRQRDKVIQQYTMYDLPGPGILSHISLWQTRWTLHFELGRLLFDQYFFRKIYKLFPIFNIFRPFHYVIGHGLFMHFKTWLSISGFPQDEPNEDAFLGLMLHLNGFSLESIPKLEYAETAKNIKIYIKQQSVWYNGPLFAFRYLYRILKCQNNGRLKRTKIKESTAFALIGTIKLFSHAVYWLLGPLLIWFIIPIIYICNNEIYSLLFWLLLAIYHCFVLNLLAYEIIQKITQAFYKKAPGNLGTSIIAYMLHCIGPFYCLYKTIKRTNTIENKYKTEK